MITAEEPVAVGEQLVTDPRVDMVSFTGSTAVGKHIMALASGTVKKVFLELGGKSANIILDDADLGREFVERLGGVLSRGTGLRLEYALTDAPRGKQAEVEELLTTYFGFITYGDPCLGKVKSWGLWLTLRSVNEYWRISKKVRKRAPDSFLAEERRQESKQRAITWSLPSSLM